MSNNVRKQKRFKRKGITLEEKIEVIKRYENNERTCDIARLTGLNEATLRSIRSSAEHIKKCYADSTSVGAKRSTKARPKVMQVMEEHLIDWFKSEILKNSNISQLDIKIKALEIFENIKKDFPDEINLDFAASSGWFHRFKMRQQLQNIKLSCLVQDSVKLEVTPQRETEKSKIPNHLKEDFSSSTSEKSLAKTYSEENTITCDKIKVEDHFKDSDESNLSNTNMKDILLINLSQIEESLGNLQQLDNKIKNSSVIVKKVLRLLKPYYDMLDENFQNETGETKSSIKLGSLVTFDNKLEPDTKRLKLSVDSGESNCELILPV